MRRTVVFAKLHQELFIPGTGHLGTTFPPVGRSLKIHRMSIGEDGLEIRFFDGSRDRVALVPAANVAGMELVDEEDPVDRRNRFKTAA